MPALDITTQAFLAFSFIEISDAIPAWGFWFLLNETESSEVRTVQTVSKWDGTGRGVEKGKKRPHTIKILYSKKNVYRWRDRRLQQHRNNKGQKKGGNNGQTIC